MSIALSSLGAAPARPSFPTRRSSDLHDDSRCLEKAMTTQVWKEFEDHQITHSMAHYLMAIQDLLKSQGYARVTDVARELEITPRSEEHTSELQSRENLVCRLLLEKKK